jgi:hypothetical protein
MGQGLLSHSPRTHCQGFQTKAPNSQQRGIGRLEFFFTANDVDYQLVPPHCHRCSAAERAIRTFKEHFVAGLASVYPTFPLHLWDRLLPQAEIRLNLLGTSRLHPQLSAAAHFHGLVDYNKTAFAPPGATSLHTRNRESAERGHPTANTDILWAQQCITAGVKMSTSLPRLVNASWAHSSFSLTIIRCPSYPPLTDCSWRPTTCQMHYNTRIRRCLSLTSEITPSLCSQHWRKILNSNLKNLTFP